MRGSKRLCEMVLEDVVILGETRKVGEREGEGQGPWETEESGMGEDITEN